MRGGRAAAARAEETRVMRDAVQDGMAAAREAISVGVDVSDFFSYVSVFFPLSLLSFSRLFVSFFACVCGLEDSCFLCVCARARVSA